MRNTNIMLNTITENDCRDIWLWRNHPEVRKNFFNREPVSWKEHKKWFSSKVKDSSTKIYIALDSKDKVGIIRFELENKCAKVSVNLNPAFFRRGFGSEIIKIGTDRFYEETKSQNPVIAEIKKDNVASLKAFEKAGYEIKGKKRKKIIYEKIRELTLKGKKICLRPLERGDINKRYLSWLNDPEVTKYMDTKRSTKRDLEEFYDKVSKSRNKVIFAIIKGNTHIGNIKLRINWFHRYADLGVMIGEKKYWGKGYGQEACKLLLEYAFKTLNLNKVILGAYGNHKSAIRAYENVGFKIEGRIKKLLNFEGKHVDKVNMGILRKEFLK